MWGDFSNFSFLFDVLLKWMTVQLLPFPDVVREVPLKDTYVLRVTVSNVYFHQKDDLVPFMWIHWFYA